MKIIIILLISLLNGQNLLDYLSGPITFRIGLINGYDDNVLRLSNIEKSQASTNKIQRSKKIWNIFFNHSYNKY